MGYLCQDLREGDFFILTRKAKALENNMIWLIGGEGNPRHYYLCQVFRVDHIQPSTDPAFRYKAIGSKGVRFDPVIEISGLPWFESLKKALGNFAFGLSELSSGSIKQLEKIANSSEQYQIMQNEVAGKWK